MSAPPVDYRALVRRASTWMPEELGLPATALREARRLAREVSATAGRGEAVARHLVAVAACAVGRASMIARVSRFQAPGLLLADPQREAFFWSLDPGVPAAVERRAIDRLAPLLRGEVPRSSSSGASAGFRAGPPDRSTR